MFTELETDAARVGLPADTVVIFPPLARDGEREELSVDRAARGESVILEKPASKADNVSPDVPLFPSRCLTKTQTDDELFASGTSCACCST
jgi:hypothetical protein